MATQQERRELTRAKLVDAARVHFVRDGYDNTHTNDILARAGLSRGALYHHFGSKQELFEAVFVAASDDAITRAVRRGGRRSSPLEELTLACLAWLKTVRHPQFASILLDQGPQVLGWKRARDLEARSSLGIMLRGLERAMDAGEVQVPSLELSARLINAMLAETALAALHREPATSVAKQEATVRQFIEALRP